MNLSDRSAARFSLIHQPSGIDFAAVRRVGGWWAKGWGVLGYRMLPPGEGIWLPGVASVHTYFVRVPLDLLFLDEDLRTVRVVLNVPSWTPLVSASGAHHTLELGAGTISKRSHGIQEGDPWSLRPL